MTGARRASSGTSLPFGLRVETKARCGHALGLALARASHERFPMDHDQFSLSFLDTTSLGGGFGLYDGSPTPKRAAKSAPTRDGAEQFEAPVSEPSSIFP